MKKKSSNGFFVKKFNIFFQGFSNFYKETLDYWINKKKTVITFIFLIIAGSIALFMYTNKELLPKEDRGVYLVIGFTDEGSSFDYTQEKAQVVEKRLLPLLQAENSPYDKFIMRVPGFGSSANSFNSFIINCLPILFIYKPLINV